MQINEEERKWAYEAGELQLSSFSQSALTEQTLSSWGMTVTGVCVFRAGVKISLVSQATWIRKIEYEFLVYSLYFFPKRIICVWLLLLLLKPTFTPA